MERGMRRKVWVTGTGLVTALGADAAATWENLAAGKAGRAAITLFGTDGCRCREGAEIRELPPCPPVPGRAAKRISRASRLALAAARQCLSQAGWLDADGRCADPGLPLSLSTTGGAMDWGEGFFDRAHQGKRSRRLTQVALYHPQHQARDLRAAFGLEGSCQMVANACASGANAIGHGFELIRAGWEERVLCGGYEALAELIYAGFDCLQALAPEACRPFSQNRNGLMLGEGAGFLMLESESSARARGARPLAVLSGYGQATDLFHLTQPAADGAALAQSMRDALACAGIGPERVGYVNAHGTGTAANDGAEAGVFARVLGPGNPWTASSTKAAIGHTLGAAGAVEAVLAVLVLQRGRTLPQIQCEQPLPDIAAHLARGEALPGDAVMSVNLGFGGSNAALVLEKADGA
jgi:3-oxoacyl-[acyl-carrier-protein] synthase II